MIGRGLNPLRYAFKEPEVNIIAIETLITELNLNGDLIDYCLISSQGIPSKTRSVFGGIKTPKPYHSVSKDLALFSKQFTNQGI